MDSQRIYQKQIQKYQMMVKILADDIFHGDYVALAQVLQHIAQHYGMMELSIIEPLYVGWLYLLENGFTNQEEIGEVMWKVYPKIDKQIFTRMSSFIIIEWMKQKG